MKGTQENFRAACDRAGLKASQELFTFWQSGRDYERSLAAPAVANSVDHFNDAVKLVANAAPAGELPPLPERDGDWAGDDWFTADSMQAHARAAVAASAPKQAAELTDNQIGNIFDELGGVSGFCKNFCYLQFARAIEAVAAPNVLLVEALKQADEAMSATWSYVKDTEAGETISAASEAIFSALAATGVTQPKEDHGAT